MHEQAGLPRPSALAAASGLLLLAWIDVGLTGSRLLSVSLLKLLVLLADCAHVSGVFFLAAFEVWALACVTHRPASALRLPAQCLWSCVATAACAVLLVQLILQSVLLASHPSWASSTRVQLVLHWLGFSKADGGTRLLAVWYSALCSCAGRVLPILLQPRPRCLAGGGCSVLSDCGIGARAACPPETAARARHRFSCVIITPSTAAGTPPHIATSAFKITPGGRSVCWPVGA